MYDYTFDPFSMCDNRRGVLHHDATSLFLDSPDSATSGQIRKCHALPAFDDDRQFPSCPALVLSPQRVMLLVLH